MKVNEILNLRKKFNKAFCLPTSRTPRVISESRAELHYLMMLEELNEYNNEQQKNDKNKEKVADALIDMQEVLFGMFAEHGMLDKWSALYQEVHKSNMSKLNNDGDPIINGKNGYDADRPLGKLLKSSNFIEPDFLKVLEN